MSMTSRQRILAAINHQAPDRLPLDLGATRVTGIQPGALTRLRRALGLPAEPVKVMDVWQMLGWVDRLTVAALDGDALPVPRLEMDFGMRLDTWRPWNLDDGAPVLMPGNFAAEKEPDGSLVIRQDGEIVARKTPSTAYFDKALEMRPLRENPPVEVIPLAALSDEELTWRRQWAETLRAETDAALVGEFGFNLGRWGSYQEWLYTLGADPGYVRAWYARKTEFLLDNVRRYADAVGGNIDVFWLMEDFGTQKGMMISPRQFKELIAPCYKRLFDWVHAHTPWKVFFHSCGGIYPIIPALIECGVDILNPVQTTAAGMDAARLKAEFGDQLTFWGGGIDTQDTLPFGSPEEVRRQVSERIELFAPGGGFVFNPIHNIQEDVPVENLLAMYAAVREAGAAVYSA